MMRIFTKKVYKTATWCAILTILVVSSVSMGADWPVYRGPDHNGISKEVNWKADWGATGPKVLWRASVGIGFSSITVADGKAYTMGNSGEKSGAQDTVFCFDAVTGKEIWKHTYDCPLAPKWYEGGTLATPTVDGNVVYSISKMGHLFCINAGTGKVVWQKDMNKELGCKQPTWLFSGSPLVVGDKLIFNLGSAGVALDKKTGQVIWQNGKDICGYATPVPCTIDGKQGVAIAGADSIMGVAVNDGEVLWKHGFVNRTKVNAADPIVSGNEVFASSGYNRGCIKFKVNGGNTTQIWDNRKMRNHMNCSMLWKGHLYGFDESSLKCIAFADSSEKWSDKSLGKGALMMSADGRMIIMSDKGELVIAMADPSGFKALARANILPRSKCWTVPVLANGKIYARNAKGDVVCVAVQ